MRHPFRLMLTVLGLGLAWPSPSQAVVLTFEGLQDQEEILGFYDGGFGSLGSGPGTDFDITFSAGALAVIDSDAGGTGNFANEPSGDTAAAFLTSPSLVMNVLNGFTTGLSFFYTSSAPGLVTIYDGLNGAGNALASVNLVAQGTAAVGCTLPGDPNGAFNCWDEVGLAFAGTALSVDFGGTANAIGFDNITVPAQVPEPAPLLLLGACLGLLAVHRRRRTGDPAPPSS